MKYYVHVLVQCVLCCKNEYVLWSSSAVKCNSQCKHSCITRNNLILGFPALLFIEVCKNQCGKPRMLLIFFHFQFISLLNYTLGMQRVFMTHEKYKYFIGLLRRNALVKALHLEYTGAEFFQNPLKVQSINKVGLIMSILLKFICFVNFPLLQ